jgi:phosphatidylserine decarboxylase
MTVRAKMLRVLAQEDINFLLTNRIPRRLATQFMGWFSRIENPLVREVSIAVWRLFSDLDLREARKTEFKSLHDCFVRQLKEGSRPIDGRADVLVSPCDAIVGACGAIAGTTVFQAKGFPYALDDLLPDKDLVATYRDGCYATLRLTAAMYHRFHAPHDCRVAQVIYISGDTWNVNPIALKRVERLFCKNERAVIPTRLSVTGAPVTLVAVAAILVASVRLHCLEGPLSVRQRNANVFACDGYFQKGEEMGWFEHGSTILVFAPKGFRLFDTVSDGTHIRMGQPLMRIDTSA